MDYEKKYKEALQKIRELLERGKENGLTIISYEKDFEEIFPELAESKDEKIRKAIHIYLDWLDGRKDCAPRGEYSIRDMIAWLEKQGQNPAWSEEDEGFLDSALWHIQNSITNGKIKAFVECPLSTWLKSLKDRIQPKQEWSEEDEKTLNEIFSVAARASLRKSTLFGKSYDYIKWQNWLKSIKQRIGE